MDSIITAPTQLHSPESDGKPMGERDVYIDAMIYLREAVRDHFRDGASLTLLFQADIVIH